jgi:hypothetical protein
MSLLRIRRELLIANPRHRYKPGGTKEGKTGVRIICNLKVFFLIDP